MLTASKQQADGSRGRDVAGSSWPPTVPRNPPVTTTDVAPVANLSCAGSTLLLLAGQPSERKRCITLRYSRMWQTKQLILHGGVILLLGLLSGVPFGRAIVHVKSEAAVRAWRVAHSGLSMGGVLLLALVMPQLQLGAPALA